MTTREPIEIDAAERDVLAAALAGAGAPDYVAVRALTVLSEDAHDRIARFTGMSREFVFGVRRRMREAGAAALLAGDMTDAERILEAATEQIVRGLPRELTLATVSSETGIPVRTLYNRGLSGTELIEMCRRRGQTICRARLEQRVLRAAANPQQRLFALVDALAEWVGSERFARDQALRARPSFAPDVRDDDLRQHLAEIDRFATALGAGAGLCAPDRFGAFAATAVAGASAWFDRREAAYDVSVAIVDNLLARRRER